MVKVWKNMIFSQFSEFLIFCRFWPLPTRVWLRNVRYRFENSLKITIPACAFLSQNRVQSGQNRGKIKNSENWVKTQFLHVSTTLVAQKLDSLAPNEKKRIWPSGAHLAKSVCLSLLKNMTIFPGFKKCYLGVWHSKVGQKCSNVKCWSFPHIFTLNGVFWHFDDFLA